MKTPTEMVIEFCSTWDKGMDSIRESVFRYFTPSTVWDNVGWAVTTGPDEALALWQEFLDRGFPNIKVDMVHIMAEGNVVLTERVDHLQDAEHNTLISVRLMGVFEFEGDKIAAWRDYSDPQVLAQHPRD